MQRQMKLAVGTPWASPFIWTKFTQNLADMLMGFTHYDYDLRFFMGHGVDPAARHTDLCLQSL